MLEKKVPFCIDHFSIAIFFVMHQSRVIQRLRRMGRCPRSCCSPSSRGHAESAAARRSGSLLRQKPHPRGQSHESHVQNVPFPLTSLPKALPAAPPADFQMQTVLQTVVSLLQIPLKSGFPGNLHKAVPGFFRRRSGMPLPPADAGTSRRQVCPAVENPPV